jgi:hypothetical protein
MIVTLISSYYFVLRWSAMFHRNFEMSRSKFLASLRALYSHKFPNSKFEGDAPQSECVARV